MVVDGGDAVRPKQAGQRDERGVDEADPWVLLGDRERLAQCVRPPANGVGAGLEVVPQTRRGVVSARAVGEVIHLGEGERRGDEILVVDLEPHARRSMVPVGIAHERHDRAGVENDRQLRAQQTGEGDERGVRQAGEGMTAGDQQGLVERVGPPADERRRRRRDRVHSASRAAAPPRSATR